MVEKGTITIFKRVNFFYKARAGSIVICTRPFSYIDGNMRTKIIQNQKFKVVEILKSKRQFTVTSPDNSWNEIYPMDLNYLYDCFVAVKKVCSIKIQNTLVWDSNQFYCCNQNTCIFKFNFMNLDGVWTIFLEILPSQK